MPARFSSGCLPACVLALALAGPGCGGKERGPGSGLVAADGGTDAGGELPIIATPGEGELYHGVFPAGTDPDTDISLSALDAYQDAVGLKVAYVYFNDEWIQSRAFPAETVKAVRDRGAVPFIRLMMRSQKVPLVTDPVYTLDRINAGEFDADLRRWAQAAKQSGGPLVVEYGTEVNGDWNPWSAPYNGGLDVGPGKFQQAYRRIVTLMRSQGAANITWALHYNSQDFPGDDPRNVPRVYYPGDDVVDWVGISAYGSERSTDQRCPSFRSLVDTSLVELRAATATKPLFIFEFASTLGNPSCPQTPWVEAALGDLLGGRWPDLRGFSWWQQKFSDDPALGGETDYLVQSNPAVLSAFRDGLAAAGAKVLDRPRTR